MTTPTKRDLAKILATLPYGVLAKVAQELAEMNEDKEFDRNPRTPKGIAETLYDWGEAQQLEDNFRSIDKSGEMK